MTVVFLTSASTSPWNLPQDFTQAGHQVELVGCGGAGVVGTTGVNGKGGNGGGGGAYSKLTSPSGNLGSTTAFQIKANNPTASAQTTNATSWESSSPGTNAYASLAGGLGSAAGTAGGGAPGTGATNGTPSPTTYTRVSNSGGTGGACTTTSLTGGGGGAGAGGPTGAGQNGGAANTSSPGGGGGGGGSNGGSSTAGAIAVTTAGGDGGQGTSGAGKGTGGTITGNPGSIGGGGEGSDGSSTNQTLTGGAGGTLGNVANWSQTYPAPPNTTAGVAGGGGATGSVSNNTSSTITGGNGANYGGGGAATGGHRNTSSTLNVGSGGGGLIVVTYTAVPAPWEEQFFYDSEFIPPFPVKEQQFSRDYPLRQIFSTTPQGGIKSSFMYAVTTPKSGGTITESPPPPFIVPQGGTEKSDKGKHKGKEKRETAPALYTVEHQQFAAFTPPAPPVPSQLGAQAAAASGNFFDSKFIPPHPVFDYPNVYFQPVLDNSAANFPSFFDIEYITPTQAKLQQWDSFQPQDQVVSITPQGFRNFFQSITIRYTFSGVDTGTVVVPTFIPPPDNDHGQGKDKKKDIRNALGSANTSQLHGFNSWTPDNPLINFSRGQTFFDKAVPIRLTPQQLGEVGLPLPATTPQQTPSGASSFFDIEYIPPLASKEQQWDAYPIRQVFSLTPQGWERFFDSASIKPLNPAQQRDESFQPAGFLFTFPPPIYSFYDLANIKPYPSKEQQWDSYPIRQVFSLTPQGWERFFDSARIKPFPIYEQRDESFQPEGSFVAPSQVFSFYDLANIKPYPSKEQQWDSYPIRQVFSLTPQGWSVFYGSTTIKPLTPTEQRDESFQQEGFIFTFPPPVYSFYDLTQIKPYPSKEQQWDSYPIRQVFSLTSQGWSRFFDSATIKPLTPAEQPILTGFQSEGDLTSTPEGFSSFFDIEFIPPLAAKMQQWDAYPIRQVFSLTPQGWNRYLETTTSKPVSPAQQREQTFQSYPQQQQVTTVVSSFFSNLRIMPSRGGFDTKGAVEMVPLPFIQSIFFDIKYIPPLASKLQQWDAYPIRQVFSLTPQGWTCLLDTKTIAPLNPAQQRDESFQPQGFIAAIQLYGGASQWFFDIKYIPPLAAKEQQWDSYPIRQVFSLTPQGWERFFDRTTNPRFLANEQQWAAFQPEGVIQIRQPYGYNWFFDSARIRPLNPALQRDQAFQTSGRFIAPQGYSVYFDSARIKPLSPAQQREGSFTPEGVLQVSQPYGYSWFFDTTTKKMRAVGYEVSTYQIQAAQYNAGWAYEFAAPVFKPKPHVPEFTTLSTRREIITWGWGQAFDPVDPRPKQWWEQVWPPMATVQTVFWGYNYQLDTVPPAVERPLLVRMSQLVPEFEHVESVTFPWGWTQAFDWTTQRPVAFPDITGRVGFRPFKGFLVCASIELNPELGGAVTLSPEVLASLLMSPEVQGTPTVRPEVTTTIVLTPETEGVITMTPEVLGTPDTEKC